MLNSMRGKIALALGLSCFLALQVAGMAGAVAAYDIGSLTTGITEQVQASLTTVLPIAGGLLALGVAWKLVRRMVKA